MSRFDAPGATRRLDAFARDLGRIEARNVDAGRHHRDALPRRAVAVDDQLRDLLAHRHHAVAARHDAIVRVLEDVLVAEALVPTGEERNAARPRGEKSAPGRRTAERMDRVAFMLARDGVERNGAAQHAQRIVAGEIERHEFTARRRHVGDQPSGLRSHDGAVARLLEDAHQPERADIGRAGIERGHRDEHRDRIARLLRARLGVCEPGSETSPRAIADGRFLTAGIAGEGKLDMPFTTSKSPVSDVAGEQRGINAAHGFGNALRRQCEFGELARAGAQRLVRGDVERKRGCDGAREFARMTGPHQPAGAQFVLHARRTKNAFRQHADRACDHGPAHGLRLRGGASA